MGKADKSEAAAGPGPWGSVGTADELRTYLARVVEELSARAEKLKQLEARCSELAGQLRTVSVTSGAPGRFVSAAFGKKVKETLRLKQLEQEKEEVQKDFERAAERKRLVEEELKKLQ